MWNVVRPDCFRHRGAGRQTCNEQLCRRFESGSHCEFTHPSAQWGCLDTMPPPTYTDIAVPGGRNEGVVVWTKLLIALGFLVIPILWGIVVNGVFDLWNGRDREKIDDDHIFPDYQI